MNVLEKIYHSRDRTISPDLKNIFEITEQSNPKGKYGTHEYKLDDFSIDKDFISEYTSEYQNYQDKLEIYKY